VSCFDPSWLDLAQSLVRVGYLPVPSHQPLGAGRYGPASLGEIKTGLQETIGLRISSGAEGLIGRQIRVLYCRDRRPCL
jgi:hypothetical protein